MFSLKTKSRQVNDSQEVVDIIRLIRSENVGIKTFYNLVKLYGTATIALEHVEELSLNGGRAKPIKIYSLNSVEKELATLRSIGADILTYLDDSYPGFLKHIIDPPPVISYFGDKKIFSRQSCSIVGARNASLNGINFTTHIASTLAKSSIVTVSGLARGIDTAVHKASLPSTIAVVAGGIDHIYPPENAALYNKIAENGAIIAELPVGSIPLGQHFPQRNRIISGLSMVTVVIEASLKSGSLITARMALEQGRDVCAVPGFPLDPRCQGTNKLIKEGAYLIESSDDVFKIMEQHNTLNIKELHENNDKFLLKNSSVDDITNSNRVEVQNVLSATPISLEAIQSHTKLPLIAIYTIILELELAGRVVRHPGNKVSMVYI
jgi:DNA processing protein